MRGRYRLLLTLSAVFLVPISGFWLWLGAGFDGFAFGLRRFDDLHLVCGAYGFHGDESDEVAGRPTNEAWYLPTVIPTNRQWIRDAQTIHSHPYRELFGFSLMAWFPTRRDWYLVIAVPFWVCAAACGLGVTYSAIRLRRLRISPGCCRSCGYYSGIAGALPRMRA
jgi:hypothetical protein